MVKKGARGGLAAGEVRQTVAGDRQLHLNLTAAAIGSDAVAWKEKKAKKGSWKDRRTFSPF